MKSCIVVFPLYRAPNKIELSFLERGMLITKAYKQVIAAPDSLIIDHQFGALQQLEVKRFADHYFQSISGYNELLLSSFFYNSFSAFEFMLIHQADVYLFKDELAFWLEKDYDYIGAPWFRPNKLNQSLIFNLWQEIKLSFKKNKIYAQRYNKVGNGGLSLRKISSALKVLDLAKNTRLKDYAQVKCNAFNEDIFWSLEAPKILPDYQIPELLEGMQFAVEFYPQIAYSYLNETLPFGCHAPLKHNPTFWKKFIPELNSNA